MLSAKDVVKAHKVLSGVVANTPLDYDHYLSEKYGAKIYLKKENAQRVRSFKIRGAYYAISQLTKEERERGVDENSCNNLYAHYNTSTENWSGSFLWWRFCNYQIGRRYL